VDDLKSWLHNALFRFISYQGFLRPLGLLEHTLHSTLSSMRLRRQHFRLAKSIMTVLGSLVGPTAIETLNRITDLLNSFVSSLKEAQPLHTTLFIYYAVTPTHLLRSYSDDLAINMHYELPSALCSFSASRTFFNALPGAFRSAKTHYDSYRQTQLRFLGVPRINSTNPLVSILLAAYFRRRSYQQDLALLTVHGWAFTLHASFFYSLGIQLCIPQPY
jgi:hypothetical protein